MFAGCSCVLTGKGLLTGVRIGRDRELTNGVLGFFFGFFLVLGKLTVGLIRVRVGVW